jgi:small subunit ribosomal protein S8
MSLQDPISDMLSRIRNALARMRAEVRMPASRQKAAIANLLKEEGYIADVREETAGSHKTLVITLKYFEGRPVIERLERVSRPGLRRYRTAGKLPRVLNGLGTSIVSTSKGLITDRAANKLGIGGEVICIVS